MNLPSKKRFLFLGGGVLLLGILGFVVYQYFSSDRETTGSTGGEATGRLPAPSENISTGTAPRSKGLSDLKPGEEVLIAEEQKLYRITDFPVVSPALSKEQDKILFYKKEGGDLFSSDFTGQFQEKISNITVLGMMEAIWSPQKDRAAVFYLDLDYETLKGFLHIGTSTISPLPQNVRSFSWSPDGKSLAYLIQDGERFALVIGASSGKNAKTEFRTPLQDAFISWISANKISFHTAPSGLAQGYLFVWSRSNGTFERIVGPLFGLMPSWSPDGTRVLISSTDKSGSNLKLAVYDDRGKELFQTTLQTLPEKCVWASSKEIYCAVPHDISQNNVWPDDYLRGEINSSDRLVVLDLERKEVSEVFNQGDFDMANLALTKTKDWIFWVDRKDDSLWSLKIR
jgi:Tol biopolymer transport system component